MTTFEIVELRDTIYAHGREPKEAYPEGVYYIPPSERKITVSSDGVTATVDTQRSDVKGVVDAADVDSVRGIVWSAALSQNKRHFYISGYLPDLGVFSLHKFISGFAVTDHINGNPLDNRRANLRDASAGGNAANRSINDNNTTGLPNITYSSRHVNAPWRVNVGANGENNFYVKYHATLEAAINDRDKTVRETHGKFGVYIFPRNEESSLRDANGYPMSPDDVQLIITEMLDDYEGVKIIDTDIDLLDELDTYTRSVYPDRQSDRIIWSSTSEMTFSQTQVCSASSPR